MFQKKEHPKIKFSTFDYRDDLGTVTDHQPTDAQVASVWGSDWAHASMFQETKQRTDRVPTHIRVSGYEISEHINHDAAAKYGWLFVAASTPDLEEEEAYKEAVAMVWDALSMIEGQRLTSAAQLQWELEDELRLFYYPYDGGPETDGSFLLDSLQIEFGPGNLTQMAILRKQHA